MKHFGDITKIHGWEVPIVDVVTGGSPCQDLSVAGKREGLAGERSGLFMEQIRIVKEMRECGVTDELVLVVPYMFYMSCMASTWERVKEETGVDHVERSEIGFPNDVECMVVQRSEYLRMFIKSLGEKESESNGNQERKDN